MYHFMETFISTLEKSIPLIIIVFLTLFMSLETLYPFLTQSKYRRKQQWHNVGNLLVSFALNAVLSGFVSYALTISSNNQFGLLYYLKLPFIVALVIGILLSDLNGYIAHRLYHRVPLFWRFHRVHHSDIELDASSALRMHPFEFIFQATTQATILPLLGVSNSSFVIYVACSLPLFIINHANIKLPDWYEKYVSILFITPNWHRVHHSCRQIETDSNYADVFTFWDRIFATHTNQKPEEITFGLETLREQENQTFWGMLFTPFKSLK
jgi:sterol desaturase/sphingolipid hydroxylase (fatty acid hydroxylase superfamily)